MIHNVLVAALWPGDEPITPGEPINHGLLSSAVGRPMQTMFNQDLYKGVFQKGAALFHSLIANHPFYNGNKRTAVLALDHFLMANGRLLILTNEEMYRLAKETATYNERKMTHKQIFRHIARTIRRSSVPISKLKKSPAFSILYENLRGLSANIRNHPLNKSERT